MQSSRLIQACFWPKSLRFESTDFVSIMVDDVAADVISVPSVWREASNLIFIYNLFFHDVNDLNGLLEW